MRKRLPRKTRVLLVAAVATALALPLLIRRPAAGVDGGTLLCRWPAGHQGAGTQPWLSDHEILTVRRGMNSPTADYALVDTRTGTSTPLTTLTKAVTRAGGQSCVWNGVAQLSPDRRHLLSYIGWSSTASRLPDTAVLADIHKATAVTANMPHCECSPVWADDSRHVYLWDGAHIYSIDRQAPQQPPRKLGNWTPPALQGAGDYRTLMYRLPHDQLLFVGMATRHSPPFWSATIRPDGTVVAPTHYYGAPTDLSIRDAASPDGRYLVWESASWNCRTRWPMLDAIRRRLEAKRAIELWMTDAAGGSPRLAATEYTYLPWFLGFSRGEDKSLCIVHAGGLYRIPLPH